VAELTGALPAIPDAETHTPPTPVPPYVTVPAIEPPCNNATLADAVPVVTTIDDTFWSAYDVCVVPPHVGSTSSEYVPAASPEIVYEPFEMVVALP
jgi:hypothetical protein